MENCISEVTRLHKPTALSSGLEAGLLEGLYEIHNHNPAPDACGQSRVDALLGSNLSMIRGIGGNYLDEVFRKIQNDEPRTAEALNRAVIQPNGNIEFPSVGQIYYPSPEQE